MCFSFWLSRLLKVAEHCVAVQFRQRRPVSKSLQNRTAARGCRVLADSDLAVAVDAMQLWSESLESVVEPL